MRGLLARARSMAAWVAGTVPGRLARKFVQDGAPSQAVLIAWNLLQTLFPVALAVTTILGLLFSSVGLRSTVILQTIATAIPDQAGQQQVITALEAVRTKTGLFAIIALAGFLWSASNLFGAMEQAFDAIFHVPVRPFLRQKVMAVIMMVILVVLAGLGIVTSTLLPVLSSLANQLPVPHGPTALIEQVLIGVAAGFVLFSALYYVVPNRKQRFRDVWPGALLAGLGFELLTLAFPLYLVISGPGMNQYGKTFAFLFILTAFLYFLGLLTMVGVELNALLEVAPPLAAPSDRAMAADPAERENGGGRPSGRLRRLGFGALGAAIGLVALAAGSRKRARP